MPFYSQSQLPQELARLGIHLAKNRGQCYLIDRNILTLIRDYAKLDYTQDIVLEIGPGIGQLSDILIEHSKRVYLVETDRKIVQFLTSYYDQLYPTIVLEPQILNYEHIAPEIRVVIIPADVLSIPLPPVTKVVANIPYQISGPLMFALIEQWSFTKVILMVQKEFAERLTASPNSPQYSRLSAAIHLYLDIHILHSVSSSCFFPRPRVESQIIQINAKPSYSRSSPLFQYRSEFFTFLQGIFPYKNKTFRNTLIHFQKAIPENAARYPYLSQVIQSLAQTNLNQEKLRSISPELLFELMCKCLFGLNYKEEKPVQDEPNSNHIS